AGNSLGGWLAWEYAIDFPEKTDKLVLIDSAGIETDRHVPLPVRLARLPMAKYLMRFMLNRKTVTVFAKEVYAHPETVPEEILDRYYDLFAREGNPEAFIALVNTPFADRSQEIHTIQNETFIVWGEADKWLPVINGYRFLEMIPNASLLIYDDLGHVPMEEAPQVTGNDVRAFLRGEKRVAVE
ncbi:MAG: alpha/beta hydrolase, partial [Bacteroidota bacterium]